MRVALIGGSFNPPHIGHLLAAHYVRAARRPDQVWWVPAYRHPFGKGLAPFEHRVEMCRRLCEDASGWLRVDPIEQELPGEGRTVDLLEALTARHPETRFSWVMGSDILKELPQWKQFDRVRVLADVWVLHRAGHPSPEAFGPPLAEVSSTAVRDALATGREVEDLVPQRVLEYLREHRLYLP